MLSKKLSQKIFNVILRTILKALPVLIGVLIWTSPLISKWSDDPYNPIVVYDAADFGGSPRKVQICGSEDGGCFIVWEDPYYSLNQIRAQKISIEGDLLWDDEGVIVRPNRGNNDIPPDNSDALANISDVLSDGEGGVYVLWRDYANSDLVMEMRGWVNNEIYAQHIDADGELLWQDDELGLLICSFIPEEENQRFAGNLLSDGDGGCFFTWFDEHNPNDDSRNSIYLQRLSPDGELLLGENGTCIGQNDFTSAGKLYSDQQGGFFIDEYRHIFHVSNEGEFWDDPLPDALNGWMYVFTAQGPSGSIWRTGYAPYDEQFDNIEVVNLLSSNRQYIFDFPGIQFTPFNEDTISYNEHMRSDLRGGCYVILRRGRDPLRVQQAFHIDRNGNHLWGRGGIHIPIGTERRGFGSRQNHVDRLGFYGTLLDFDESGYRYYCYKIGYNGDLLWGEDGRLMFADSTGSQNWWGSDYMVDEYGNQFWVLTFAPYRQRTKVLAWALSAEGELGELLSEIHYPPDLFNLTTPNDGDTLELDTAVVFTWQRSIDLNEEDEVEYRIWFGSNQDSLYYATADTSIEVRPDSLNILIEDDPVLWWWVQAISNRDITECWTRFQFHFRPTGIEKAPSMVPGSFAINSLYPNPFNSMTTITYTLPTKTSVSLSVYDLYGREVVSLIDGDVKIGRHSVVLDSEGLASGIYFVRLAIPGRSVSRKILLVR